MEKESLLETKKKEESINRFISLVVIGEG